MWRNKDLNDLAKKADNGLHGLGGIIRAIATLDKKSAQQQKLIIIMTAVILVLTLLTSVIIVLQFYKLPINKNTINNNKPKTYSTTPESHTENTKNSTVINKEISQGKTKTD
ncbi:MAG: hypothetical protein JYX80_10460 [Candidatus Scalindua sediminis]|nr:hypothetical protein [Candidatus Scalindua sediminis]